MKYVAALLMFSCVISCATIEPLPDKDKQYIYREFRFKIIDLFEAQQITETLVLVYAGTVDNNHLLIGLPNDKFNFKRRDFFALPEDECKLASTYPPEQNLFYNFNKVETWKGLKIAEGTCIIQEERYLKDLF